MPAASANHKPDQVLQSIGQEELRTRRDRPGARAEPRRRE